MSPQGSPLLEPVRELPPDPPRLCEAGPCRHYHRFQIQLDAQNPMDERKPDGTVVRHGRVFHVQTHHYCYPDVGIELELGALPLLECNRWVPLTSLFRRRRGIRRRFDSDVAVWKLEQERARDQVAESVETDAAVDLASEPQTTVQITVVVAAPFGFAGTAVIDAQLDCPIRDVGQAALDDLVARGFTVNPNPDPDDVALDDENGPIGNPTATVQQLGYEGTATIRLTILPNHDPKEPE
jgi:hypothetical protein